VAAARCLNQQWPALSNQQAGCCDKRALCRSGRAARDATPKKRAKKYSPVGIARRAGRVVVGPGDAGSARGARAGGGREPPQVQGVGVTLVDVDEGGGRRRRLVVLGGEAALVQLVFGRVRLGRRLDVHEGDRGAQSAAALLRGCGWRRRIRPGSRGQQFDALYAAIPVTQKNNTLIKMHMCWAVTVGTEVATRLQMADFSERLSLCLLKCYESKLNFCDG